MRCIYRIHLYLLLFLYTHSAVCVLRDAVSGIKSIQIKSVNQKIDEEERVTFQGDVEILVDEKLHVWADRVLLDKNKQYFVAESTTNGGVIIEDNEFLILADKFTFDFINKTGIADALRFHIDEGFISARRAEKINDFDWNLEDVVYTACDQDQAHWQITASKAVVHSNCFIKAKDIVFKIGKLPLLWLPRFVVPIQGHSKSGFMIPRFSFDYDYGLGIKQEYYKYISPHCDTIVGIDWNDRKGIVFSDEFRWARSPVNYSLFNAQYAILRDRYVQRNNKIVKGTDHCYWINGKDFRQIPSFFGDYDLSTLLRVDFGTDKDIGYYFFNNTQEIDDTFYNSLVARLGNRHNQIAFSIDDAKVRRKQFMNLSSQERNTYLSFLDDGAAFFQNARFVRELEERENTAYLPHLEWNSAFKKYLYNLRYRHDLFFDQVLYRQREYERIFVQRTQLREKMTLPLRKTDLVRFTYQGHLLQSFSLYDNTFSFKIDPRAQFVSHRRNDSIGTGGNNYPLSSQAGYRFLVDGGIEWALPEGCFHTQDYSEYFSIQPIVSWQLTPKINQRGWYHFDKWDKVYPQNELAFRLRNSVEIKPITLDLHVKQAYDFYRRNEWFWLRRGIKQKHALPFSYEVNCTHDNFYMSLGQEYEWRDFQLLQSELNIGLCVKRVQCGIGYLFQKRDLMIKRNLLANIPHFISLSTSVPLGKRLTLGYEGQFYAEHKSSIFSLDGITPLIHRVRLDYDGHCWGVYVGYEEKKYKEYGIGRDERAIVLSFRLDSLGSFAKKIKRMPQFFKNQ